jgi:hypothetical protein
MKTQSVCPTSKASVAFSFISFKGWHLSVSRQYELKIYEYFWIWISILFVALNPDIYISQVEVRSISF